MWHNLLQIIEPYNLPLEGLIVFDLPVEQRIKLRTLNMAEKINKEIKRRTKIVGIFPNNTPVSD